MNSYVSIEEVEKIILKLNSDEEILEVLNLSMSTDGFCIIVDFLGYQIWSSECDERDYYEETDSYEDLEDYLIRICNDFIKSMSKFRFKKEV